jgi:cytochrome b
MGTVRFIHYVAAAFLVMTGIVRLYWLFAGNKFERWKALFPVTRKDIVNLFRQMKHYAMLDKHGDEPHYMGHNPLQQLSYTAVYVLALIQVVTGFALYVRLPRVGVPTRAGYSGLGGLGDGALPPPIATWGSHLHPHASTCHPRRRWSEARLQHHQRRPIRVRRPPVRGRAARRGRETGPALARGGARLKRRAPGGSPARQHQAQGDRDRALEAPGQNVKHHHRRT